MDPMLIRQLLVVPSLYLALTASLTVMAAESNGGSSGTPVKCVTSSAQAASLEAPAAQPPASEVQGASPLPTCDALLAEEDYLEAASPWRIGFGAGYGQRTNPLINSDDIPIYGILQLSWFGDDFFFDNGDVGWFMAEGSAWSANIIAGVGGERSFFSYLNDIPVGFGPDSGVETGFEPGPAIPGQPGTEIPFEGEQQTVEAPDRDFVIDGGLEVLYDLGESELQLQALTDISNKHNGQELWLSWGVPAQWGDLSFYPSAGVTWMSRDAANYYYGVRGSEAQPGLPAYEVGAALNYFFRLSASYRLSEHWAITSVLQFEQLADEISDSPSVTDDNITTSFIGLYYEF